MQKVVYKGRNNTDKSLPIFFSYEDVSKLDLYGDDRGFINQIAEIGMDERWLGHAFDEFMELVYYHVPVLEGNKDKYTKHKRIFYAYKLEADKDNIQTKRILGFVVTDKNSFVSNNNKFLDSNQSDYIELFAMRKGWRDKGIGKKLLKYTVDMLASFPDRSKYIGLYMCPENERALRVYNLNGFEINQYINGQAFMFKVNDKNLKLLTEIASKGIELVYSNASNKYLNTYFHDIEFMSEKLGNDSQTREEYFKDISDYVKNHKRKIKEAQEIVKGFKNFKKKNPFLTFRDYMDVRLDSKKGILKNSTTIYKKPKSSSKSRLIKTMYIKLNSKISTGRSNISRDEMHSTIPSMVNNSDLRERNR